MAAALLSVYFLAVVASYYHELVAPAEMQKFKEQAAVVTFTDKNTTGGVVIEEQTVLVALEHEDTPPAPRHPCPDEVIIIGDSNKPKTNPFLGFLSTTLVAVVSTVFPSGLVFDDVDDPFLTSPPITSGFTTLVFLFDL